MNISNINFLPQIKVKSPNRLNFCAQKPLQKDTFEKSSQILKTVTIKDTDGNDVDAVIKEENYRDDNSLYGTNPKKYSLNVNGEKLGQATVYDSKKGDKLYIKDISTEENLTRHYKGAGTELLKYLVEESKKRGHKGRLECTASHFPAPFVFYYKNNFGTLHRFSKQLAAIDYAARNNIPVGKLLEEDTFALPMQLDEKGAEALLAGERLYEQRASYTIAETKINDEEYEANYTEAQNGIFYFQIINKDADTKQQVWFATGEISKDMHGDKVLQLYPLHGNSYTPSAVQDFAKDGIKVLSDNLGIKSYRTCEVF